MSARKVSASVIVVLDYVEVEVEIVNAFSGWYMFIYWKFLFIW